MLQVKKHIPSKFLVVLLTIILVAPVFVKSYHIFEDHKHEVCKTPNKTHFHEYEIDCEFYNFKLNTQFNLSITSDIIPVLKGKTQSITSQYYFISDYQQLQFSLRGPPLSV